MTIASADPLSRWLGQPISAVPVSLQARVIEYVLGVPLLEAAEYAAEKARYALYELDPDMQHSYEDVAQDVLAAMFEPLPTARIEFWRTYILNAVRWRVRHLRRQRLAEKRHPGQQVEFDDAVALLERTPSFDSEERLLMRHQLADALAQVPDPQLRAVLQATYVLPTHDSGYDVRTAAEVAELLGMSASKVKRLWTLGKPVLKHLLESDNSGDHS